MSNSETKEISKSPESETKEYYRELINKWCKEQTIDQFKESFVEILYWKGMFFYENEELKKKLSVLKNN